MTITNLQAAGKTQDSASAVTLAFSGNVTNGSLLVIGCSKFESSSSIDFVAGDCTKSAGTATIGTIALDKHLQSGLIVSGIWSIPVTGTGSCTISIASIANTFFVLGITEFSGTFDSVAANRLEASNSGSGSSTLQASGNMTSAGAALFFGATALDTGNNETTYTEDGAFTRIYREPDGTTHAVGLLFYKLVGSGNTDSADTTTSGANTYVAIGTVYKEVSASTGKLGLTGGLTGSILTEGRLAA